jgi:hypothetical protein
MTLLHLPSNSCLEEYNNQNTDFTVRLAKEIKTMHMSVAVRSVIIPLSHYNVSGKNVRLWYLSDCPVKDTSKLKITWDTEANVTVETKSGVQLTATRYEVNEGQYTDINYFLNWIKYILRGTDIRFKFDDSRNRIQITVPKNRALIWPHELTRIGQICGFEEEILTSGTHLAARDPFSVFSVDYMNILCDLIEPQNHAGKLLPVIRTVPYKGKQGSFLFYRFNNPYFYPINRDSIKTVRISLTDDDGNPINLERGITIIVLELKKNI